MPPKRSALRQSANLASYIERRKRQSLGLDDSILASSSESRNNSDPSPHYAGADPRSPPAMSLPVSTFSSRPSFSVAFTDSTQAPIEDSPPLDTDQTQTSGSRASITADDCPSLVNGQKITRSSAKKWVRKPGRMIAHSYMELNGQPPEAETLPLSDAWKLLETQGKRAYRRKRKRWVVNERSVKRDAWREAIEDARNLERARRTISEETIDNHVNEISTWLQATSWPKWTYYPNDGHAIYVKMVLPRILAIVHSAIRPTSFAVRYRALLALTHILLHFCRYCESGVGKQVMQCYASGVMHEKGNLLSKYMLATTSKLRSRDIIADGMLAILEKVDDGGSNIKWLKEEEGGAADMLRQEMRGVYWLIEEHMPKNARSGMAFVCIYLEL